VDPVDLDPDSDPDPQHCIVQVVQQGMHDYIQEELTYEKGAPLCLEVYPLGTPEEGANEANDRFSFQPCFLPPILAIDCINLSEFS
jgi:hypothetical protein